MSKQMRYASPQAWRRLRKHLTDSEMRDIATDIVKLAGGDERLIYEAFAIEPWDQRMQA